MVLPFSAYGRVNDMLDRVVVNSVPWLPAARVVATKQGRLLHAASALSCIRNLDQSTSLFQVHDHGVSGYQYKTIPSTSDAPFSMQQSACNSTGRCAVSICQGVENAYGGTDTQEPFTGRILSCTFLGVLELIITVFRSSETRCAASLGT